VVLNDKITIVGNLTFGFGYKVDMRKVNLQVIRPWITKKVVELVGFEDEVVVEYAMGLLEDKQQPVCSSILGIRLKLIPIAADPRS